MRAFPTSRDANRNGSTSHPVVIYFPGNAGHRGYRAIELDQLSRLGADAYLVDYRGYGDNPGKPTEENLAADAQAVWKFVTTTRQVKPSQVVLLGESLGGGVATRLASELSAAGTPPGGLILRSTFDGLAEVASYHYPWLPVRMFLLDRFPSAERIAKVTCPVLVLHGNVDTIVPFESGKRLFDAAPAVSAGSVAKQFVVLAGCGTQRHSICGSRALSGGDQTVSRPDAAIATAGRICGWALVTASTRSLLRWLISAWTTCGTHPGSPRR